MSFVSEANAENWLPFRSYEYEIRLLYSGLSMKASVSEYSLLIYWLLIIVDVATFHHQLSSNVFKFLNYYKIADICKSSKWSERMNWLFKTKMCLKRWNYLVFQFLYKITNSFFPSSSGFYSYQRVCTTASITENS